MFGINGIIGPLVGQRLGQPGMEQEQPSKLAQFLNRPQMVRPMPVMPMVPGAAAMGPGVALPGAGGHRALNPPGMAWKPNVGFVGGQKDPNQDMMELLRKLFGQGGGQVGFGGPELPAQTYGGY